MLKVNFKHQQAKKNVISVPKANFSINKDKLNAKNVRVARLQKTRVLFRAISASQKTPKHTRMKQEKENAKLALNAQPTMRNQDLVKRAFHRAS